MCAYCDDGDGGGGGGCGEERGISCCFYFLTSLSLINFSSPTGIEEH